MIQQSVIQLVRKSYGPAGWRTAGGERRVRDHSGQERPATPDSCLVSTGCSGLAPASSLPAALTPDGSAAKSEMPAPGLPGFD